MDLNKFEVVLKLLGVKLLLLKVVYKFLFCLLMGIELLIFKRYSIGV